jgi:hypothetical protein
MSLSPGQIRLLQQNLNLRLRARGRPGVAVDGEYGPQTREAVHLVKYLLGFKLEDLDTGPSEYFRRIVAHPDLRPVAYLARAAARKAYLAAQRDNEPLRLRAYREAERLIGVMERGANNRGAQVEQIIREGGGLPGQAWCGWFLACVYKRAGSKAVTWQMGAVRLWLPLSGVKRVKQPYKGNAVRFTFDHIGMFVKDNGNGTIETIEGNTGASGARSDSSTGGDGVYRKVRSKSQVRDYLHITR